MVVPEPNRRVRFFLLRNEKFDERGLKFECGFGEAGFTRVRSGSLLARLLN